MDVALFHHLPLAGGAPRVLVEYVRHAPQHRFTVYTRQPEQQGLMRLPDEVTVRRFAPLDAANPVSRMVELWTLPRRGAALARAIDTAGHDVVFCQPSFLVQAPEVLPFLRTPALYYAPEPLRTVYEPPPEFGRDRSLRARIAELGVDPYERRRRALDRRHIRAARHVMTHSRFTAVSLRGAYGVEADVVPLGVDASAFAAAARPERERFVLSVGALHPLKGHQFVIEAIATLPAPRPPLVVIGDRGTAGPELAALARDRGVELDVRRGVPQDELVALYSRAGVLACGQLREPFGLITLEGMAAGTPVVAVREGGFEETVRDGETGLLVDRDAVAFGRALATVLDDPALAGRLSAAGRAEAARWTWEQTARGIDALLERAVADRGRTRA
jgi:glycosyltransferase involved in cell wall biosynthesis